MFSKLSRRAGIIILSIILGIMAGLLDSIIDAIFFYHSKVFDEIFHPSNFEIYIRIFLLIIFLLFGIVTAIGLELKQSKRIQEEKITELKNARDEIAILKGYLPICAYCKQIRDKNGSWHQLEQYITDHSGARFTHGLCPECSKKALADLENSVKS